MTEPVELDEAVVPPWPDSPGEAESQIRQLVQASVEAPGVVRLGADGQATLMASEAIV